MCATPNAEPEATNTLHYQIEGKVWGFRVREIKLFKKSGSSSHHKKKENLRNGFSWSETLDQLQLRDQDREQEQE